MFSKCVFWPLSVSKASKHLLRSYETCGPESIVFVHIFPLFLPNKDGSGILQLGQNISAESEHVLPEISVALMAYPKESPSEVLYKIKKTSCNDYFFNYL